MKIKDLKENNRRLYNILMRNLFCKFYTRFGKKISDEEFKELTISDVFDLCTEKDIKSWRGLGSKGYEELLNLRG